MYEVVKEKISNASLSHEYAEKKNEIVLSYMQKKYLEIESTLSRTHQRKIRQIDYTTISCVLLDVSRVMGAPYLQFIIVYHVDVVVQVLEISYCNRMFTNSIWYSRLQLDTIQQVVRAAGSRTNLVGLFVRHVK